VAKYAAIPYVATL